MATIQEVYIALFGRPADPIGLRFYNEATDNGNNLDAVGDLTGSDEYLSRFEGQNDVQMINQIFQDLFGRDADASGLLFYTQLLQSGQASIQDIAIRIIDGATGSDQAIIDAKVAAADAFTASLDTGSEIVAYSGDAGIAFGQQFLSQIQTADDELTQDEIDAQIETFVTQGPNTPGAIYTLTNAANAQTAGVDVIEGSANNDTIRALGTDSLGSEDIIDGGAGQDVLNIAEDAISGVAAPVISNVERINNSDEGSTLNLTSVTGAQQIWSNGAGTFSYTNAALGTIFGASGAAAAQTINVDYAGSLAGRTTALLATSNTASTATFDFDADAAGIEAVSILAAAGSNATVALDADLDALDTITVTGEGRVTITSTEATLTTFDASGNTGGVSYSSGATTAAVAATGGAGNDTLNFGNATATSVVTVNAGAGNDTVTGGAGNDVINGGAGNDILTGGAGNDTIDGGEGNDIITGGVGADVLTGGAGNDVFSYTAVNQSQFVAGGVNNTMDTIVDFNNGNDTIDVSAAALNATGLNSAADLIATQNAVDALAANATLADALAAVSNSAVGEVSYFQFQGDTYVVVDVATAGISAADDLVVRLTGAVDLTAADFTF